jgi:DNA-binding transcriptional ArsR family regulator
MNAHDQPTAAILDWLAGIGAASAVELAAACGLSPRATGARLRALEDAGLIRSPRLLHGAPALHALTRRGLRAAGREELDPVAISASGFTHLLAVARVAGALADAGQTVSGERELRAAERAEGRPLASAEVGLSRDGTVALHRPDLVCWGGGAPIAIEVELTVKAPARLRTIVRGWARSRVVGGVVYYATPHAARALTRALHCECARDRVAVLPLARAGELPTFDPRVPSQALRSVVVGIDHHNTRSL